MFPSKNPCVRHQYVGFALAYKTMPPYNKVNMLASYICIYSCLIKLLVIANDYFFKDKYYPLVAFTNCDLVIIYMKSHTTHGHLTLIMKII